MDILKAFAFLRNPVLDKLMQGVTYLGEELVFMAVALILFWCVDKWKGYFILAVGFIGTILNQFLKLAFRVPRPWVKDPSFEIVESARNGAGGYSFPSGHTQNAVGTFGGIARGTKKTWLRVVLIVLSCLIAFSRMYLGVHTPLDVSVSFALSLLSAILCWYIFNKKEFIWTKPFILALILGICSLLLCAYSLALYSSGTINVDYSMDCLKASGAGCAFAIGYYVETTRIRFEIADTWKKRILRFLIGGVVAGLLLKGIKPLIGDSLAAGFVRYFLTVIWVIAIYPFLFTRFEKKHPSE